MVIDIDPIELCAQGADTVVSRMLETGSPVKEQLESADTRGGYLSIADATGTLLATRLVKYPLKTNATAYHDLSRLNAEMGTDICTAMRGLRFRCSFVGLTPELNVLVAAGALYKTGDLEIEEILGLLTGVPSLSDFRPRWIEQLIV